MRGMVTRARQGTFAALFATVLAASTHEQPVPFAWRDTAAGGWRAPADSLPARLSDADFWEMVSAMSEPGELPTIRNCSGRMPTSSSTRR